MSDFHGLREPSRNGARLRLAAADPQGVRPARALAGSSCEY